MCVRQPYMSGSPSYLDTLSGARIAYRRLEGASPGVVFLGGFMSDMSGRKAHSLEEYCGRAHRAFVCFDYRGHGLSSGSLMDCGFDTWLEDSVNVLDALTEGSQIVVGSSMGAWIMTRCLELRADRIGAAIGIGAAPDFLAAADLELEPGQRVSLEERGFCELATRYADAPYRLTRHLIESARAHGVLSRRIPFRGPVRLLHGLADTDVPWMRSVALAQSLDCPDVEVRLIAHGDHRLSRDRDLQRLRDVLGELVAIVSRA
jgi:pimeloyl-ACP methyl ester carboxylesterase